MDVLLEKYSITELSEKLKVTDHALRYYEKEFKIIIPKDERGRRYYTADLANIMYQIKSMRDDGLEIKAIKKILESENIIAESNSITFNDNSLSLAPINSKESYPDIRQFFNEFKTEITSSITKEVSSAKEHLSFEINRSKLELGACVENSSRKLEAKMDKHFQDVDQSIIKWREKSKKGFFRRFLGN